MLRLLATFNFKRQPEQKPKPIILDKALAFGIQMIGDPLPVGDQGEIEQEYFLCEECLDMCSVKNLCDQCQNGREIAKEQLVLDADVENNRDKIKYLRSYLCSRHFLMEQERNTNTQVVDICDDVISNTNSLMEAEKSCSKIKEILYGTDELNELKVYYDRLANIIDENTEHLRLYETRRRREAADALKQKIYSFKIEKKPGLQLNLNFENIKRINKELVSKLSSKYASTEDGTVDDNETVASISDYFHDFLNILLESKLTLTEDYDGTTDHVEAVLENWKSMSGQDRRNYILQELHNSKGWRDQAELTQVK